MKDSSKRVIDYMRVSITDRCNLRCGYCVPENPAYIPHEQILRYEEILRICDIMAGLGIRTVKVTGGEPLVRKDVPDFIGKLKKIPGIENVSLTTNGVLLEPYVDTLAAIGLSGVNISLDAVRPETYKRLTGRDEFDRVWRSLTKALEAGLRVKINCVPVKGLNCDEIIPIARLAGEFPVDVRFIELMPAGRDLQGVAGPEIIDILKREFPDLSADCSPRGFGPARYFKSSALKGGIGLIDAVSAHFCGRCNRLRLTSEGFLKLCLHHSGGVDLRALLREGADDSEIREKITAAVRDKPERHFLDGGGEIDRMNRIGG